MRPRWIGRLRCGGGSPLLWIAGPCVIESRDFTLAIADSLATMAQQLGIQLVFKASFDKANRSSGQVFSRTGTRRRTQDSGFGPDANGRTRDNGHSRNITGRGRLRR